MGTFYVSTTIGNSDANDGSTWTLAKQSVAGALAAATGVGPHLIYVDKDSNYSATSASITWNAATANAQISIISVNRNGSTTTGHSGWYPGARETVASNAFGFTIGSTRSQSLYIYGMNVTGASGTSASNTMLIAPTAGVSATITLDSVSLTQQGSSSAATIAFGGTAGSMTYKSYLRAINCTFSIRSSATGSGIELNAAVGEMVGCTFGYGGANKPTSLFTAGSIGASNSGIWTIRDCDLSGFNTSGGSYFLATNLATRISVINCKLAGSMGWYTGTFGAPGAEILGIVNDSGDTNYKFRFDNLYGGIVEESTYYRSAGAKFDGAGVSWKITTSSSCSEFTPFMTPWIQRWVRDTGSQSVRLELLRGSATAYKDHEVWGEFATMQNSLVPVGTLDSTRNGSPTDTSGSSLSASSEGWSGGLSPSSPLYAGVTKTIAEHSFVRARLGVGIASSVIYLCPALVMGSQSSTPAVRWGADGSAIVVEPDTPVVVSHRTLTVDAFDLDEYLKEMT